MRYQARLLGRGITQLAAFGVVDAESTIEKELARVCPGARLNIREVRYPSGPPRIVEEFEIGYSLAVDLAVEAEDEASARKAAFAAARGALEGTRFARVAWDQKVVLSAGA